ncbi:hypothetical protein Bbelb_036070 [Branchiostoma belcheri]|nr:hypothetical protein Bbelb_036070 [Branchiostoma belcheri]
MSGQRGCGGGASEDSASVVEDTESESASEDSASVVEDTESESASEDSASVVEDTESESASEDSASVVEVYVEPSASPELIDISGSPPPSPSSTRATTDSPPGLRVHTTLAIYITTTPLQQRYHVSIQQYAENLRDHHQHQHHLDPDHLAAPEISEQGPGSPGTESTSSEDSVLELETESTSEPELIDIHSHPANIPWSREPVIHTQITVAAPVQQQILGEEIL